MNISKVTENVKATTEDLHQLANAIQDAAKKGSGARLNEEEVRNLVEAMGNSLKAPWEVMDRLKGYLVDPPIAWDENLEDFCGAASRGARVALRERGGNADAVDLGE